MDQQGDLNERFAKRFEGAFAVAMRRTATPSRRRTGAGGEPLSLALTVDDDGGDGDDSSSDHTPGIPCSSLRAADAPRTDREAWRATLTCKSHSGTGRQRARCRAGRPQEPRKTTGLGHGAPPPSRPRDEPRKTPAPRRGIHIPRRRLRPAQSARQERVVTTVSTGSVLSGHTWTGLRRRGPRRAPPAAQGPLTPVARRTPVGPAARAPLIRARLR
ncbi:hypothetical protein M885DRAFT_109993 [Pelagophyceae sp. CCMP2097]|nr:hypothetical protein M885DRAFT_109993 [Pelagophyceae sp. CCMP2097]